MKFIEFVKDNSRIGFLVIMTMIIIIVIMVKRRLCEKRRRSIVDNSWKGYKLSNRMSKSLLTGF